MVGAIIGLEGATPPPSFFFFLILLYVCVLILAILYYKITFFFSLNNIIDSFKSNTILTNFFTIFLQTDLVANSYWYAYGLTTYITFLLTSKVCSSSSLF